MENGWLKIVLVQMQRDVDEIKADVKALQSAKFKVEGAYVALTVIVSSIVSFLTIFFSIK